MTRGGKQIQVRLLRIELANRLLKWLKKKRQFEGGHAYEEVIIPFAKREDVGLYEVWKAWDILRESSRRLGRPGGYFTILCTDKIKADQFGNIVGVREMSILP